MFDVVDTERYPSLRLHLHVSPILTESQAFEVSIAKWEQLVDLCNQDKLVDDEGSICMLELLGIEHSPIIVTAFREYEGLQVECPRCRYRFKIESDRLGNGLNCVNPDCQAQLKVNPFTLNLQ